MACVYLVLPADTQPGETQLNVLAIEMRRAYGLRGFRLDPARTRSPLHHYPPRPSGPPFRCWVEELHNASDPREEVEEFLADWLSWPPHQSRLLLARD